MTMTDDELSAIEARARAATGGVWTTAELTPSRVKTPAGDISVSWVRSGPDGFDYSEAEATASFIAHAGGDNGDVLRLVAEVRRLRAMLGEKAGTEAPATPDWRAELAAVEDHSAELAAARKRLADAMEAHPREIIGQEWVGDEFGGDLEDIYAPEHVDVGAARAEVSRLSRVVDAEFRKRDYLSTMGYLSERYGEYSMGVGNSPVLANSWSGQAVVISGPTVCTISVVDADGQKITVTGPTFAEALASLDADRIA